MRRVLLSIAGSTFEGAFADQPLEFAPELGHRLRAVLSRHGYTAQPPDGHQNPTARELGAAVATAIADAGPGDLLIVHVIGHGIDRRGNVLIVGSDGRSNAGTSVNGWTLDASGDDEHEDPERRHGDTTAARVLFLIDVCYAGQAARQAFDQHIDDERRRAWVVAGCLPTESGYNGHFTEALADVLDDLRGIDQHFSFPYVPLASVVRAVRRRVLAIAQARESYPQQVVATRVDLGAVVDIPFFPNPAHQPSLVGSVPAEFRDLVAAVDPLVDPWHFASRASGREEHPGRLMPGTFRGRGEQLRRMTTWLTGAEPTPLMVVTGSPGVGKSAAIGMLVCAGHPRLSTMTDKLWWDRRADLPSAPLSDLAVVHAREQELSEILRSVARQLELPESDRDRSPVTLREALLHRAGPPVLVLDALDETVDPPAVMTALATLTAPDTDGRLPCRLLIGTRAGRHWPVFQPLCDEAAALDSLVDLDAEDRGMLHDALAGYVDDLLRTDTTYGTFDMVEARHAIAGDVAEVLSAPVEQQAGPRWGEFLVAGVYVNHLVRVRTAADQAVARHRAAHVPRTLPEVLDLDLSGRTSPWLLPVLEVIAHAYGAGIPLEVISACCGRITAAADPAPERPDVLTALWEARFYLRRDHEADGTTLYRLFHQALSEHLQIRAAGRLGSRAAAHGRILDAVLDLVRRPSGRGGTWDAATTAPYLLRHAADHAAACDRIDELLTDPHFLVHADASHLSRHLRRAATPEGRAAAAIFRASLFHHLRSGAEARRSLLTIDATRQGRPSMSRRLAEATGDLPAMTWRPTWSTGGQSASLLHVLSVTSEVTAVAMIDAAGRQYAAAGGQDGMVHLWDLADETPRAVRSTGDRAVIHTAFYTSGDGDPMMFTVNGDGRLGRWTVPEASMRARSTLGCAPATVAAHLTAPSGATYVVAGDQKGHLHCIELRSGDAWTREAHAAEVTAVTTTVLADGSMVVVSADLAGDVRVWDITGGRRRPQWDGYPSWVGGITCHRLRDGTDVAVLTGGTGTAEVRDLADGGVRHLLHAEQAWTAPSACAVVPGLSADLAVIVGERGTADVRDLLTGDVVQTLRGHRSWLSSALSTTLADGTTVAITTGGDGTARIWDLRTGAARDVLTGHTNSVTGAAHLRSADGTDLLVTYGLDGRPRVWDVSLSAAASSSRAGHLDYVTSVASATTSAGDRYVVSASRDGTVLRWDAGTGEPRGLVHKTENPIMTVAAGSGRDGDMVVSGDLAGIFRHSLLPADPRAGVVTVDEPFAPAIIAVACSAAADRPFQAVLCDSWGGRTQFRPGAEEDFDVRPAPGIQVNAVAWLQAADGTPVVVTGAADGSAAVWEVETSDLRHRMPSHRGETTSVSGLGGPGGIVVTGSAEGAVRCWRLDDGEPLTTLARRGAAVTSVACTPGAEGPIVAAATADGVIRVWRTAQPTWAEVITMPEAPRSLHFTSDGGLIAGYGWEVMRFDPATTQSEATP